MVLSFVILWTTRRGNRMRSRPSLLALSLATGLTLLGAMPAQAVTENISIVSASTGFSPKTVTSAFGTTFKWTNNDSITHTSTQNSPLSLWNSGNITASHSFSKVISFAGTFAYHCNIHPSMTGTIKVPITVSPSSGTTSTHFTITVAAVAAPSGFTYDAQKRRGSGAWTTLKSGFSTKTVKFTPSQTGKWSFRARLHKGSNGATSGWSPIKSVSVS
jgi:plastocyanin